MRIMYTGVFLDPSSQGDLLDWWEKHICALLPVEQAVAMVIATSKHEHDLLDFQNLAVGQPVRLLVDGLGLDNDSQAVRVSPRRSRNRIGALPRISGERHITVASDNGIGLAPWPTGGEVAVARAGHNPPRGMSPALTLAGRIGFAVAPVDFEDFDVGLPRTPGGDWIVCSGEAVCRAELAQLIGLKEKYGSGGVAKAAFEKFVGSAASGGYAGW